MKAPLKAVVKPVDEDRSESDILTDFFLAALQLTATEEQRKDFLHAFFNTANHCPSLVRSKMLFLHATTVVSALPVPVKDETHESNLQIENHTFLITQLLRFNPELEETATSSIRELRTNQAKSIFANAIQDARRRPFVTNDTDIPVNGEKIIVCFLGKPAPSLPTITEKLNKLSQTLKPIVH